MNHWAFQMKSVETYPANDVELIQTYPCVLVSEFAAHESRHHADRFVGWICTRLDSHCYHDAPHHDLTEPYEIVGGREVWDGE